MNIRKNVVVLGGGTGGSTSLRALRSAFGAGEIYLTGVAPGSDGGGSSFILSQQYGIPAVGDARQCMSVLATKGDDLNHRFGKDEPNAGHTRGNLKLAEAFLETGNLDVAIEKVGRDIGMIGSVHLVSNDQTNLCYRRPDGSVVVGELEVIQTPFAHGEQPNLFLDPAPHLNPKAKTAIEQADVIVIGPGNIYGSITPVLMVEGVKEAIAASGALVIYISNLVTTVGQTDGFQVHDFVTVIGRYVVPDVVIYNNGPTPQGMLAQYAQEGQHWVGYDEAVLASAPYRAIGAALISEAPIERAACDPLGAQRNVLRHDAAALGALLRTLI